MKIKVVRYYDKNSRAWFFYYADKNGNQICDAMNQYQKPTLKQCKEILNKFSNIRG